MKIAFFFNFLQIIFAIADIKIFLPDAILNIPTDLLYNKNFIARAPDSVVNNDKQKQTEYLNNIKKLEENLKSLQT